MPDLLTLKEAADLLRIKPVTLYRLVHARKVPYVRPGGKILFIRDDLMAWLRETATYPGDDICDDTTTPIPVPQRSFLRRKLHRDIAAELKQIAAQARIRRQTP